MPVAYFSENAKLSNRAHQIYLILIGAAFNRQTLTYRGVADILGYKGAGVLDRQLGHIMHWCADHGLPPLTVLVVNSENGLPGGGLYRVDDLNADREKVFNFDWYDVVPPSPAELAEARELHPHR